MVKLFLRIGALPAVACCALQLMLAGCGPSAGVGTGGTGSFIDVTGKVADGYLWKATVFLDKNGNYQLDKDEDEPWTTTDDTGSYMLTINKNDLMNHPLVALAIKDETIDMTTGLKVAGSYVLSTPKENVSGPGGTVFISPISSMLRELMETGLYAGMPQAMDAVRTRMGLPPDADVMADYLAPQTQNTAMQAAAQNMATIMGNQMPQIMGSGTAAAAVDVNRYRGMMGTMFTAMSSVRTATTLSAMTSVTGTVTTAVTGIQQTTMGQPYRNMSTHFRHMMGSR